uniref:Metallothionein-like protein n=1 Tax=Picea abies TaxID=3329 RepID=Q9ZR82_PICAB|nr:metallothionein-like protein [Picea abies]
MSSGCGNCDCADKSQCTKKGNSFGVETVETSYNMSFDYEMETVGAENDCKCGPRLQGATTAPCHNWINGGP